MTNPREIVLDKLAQWRASGYSQAVVTTLDTPMVDDMKEALEDEAREARERINRLQAVL